MATMFQQRHYEALALMMQAAKPEDHWDANKKTQWEVIRNRMVEMFKADNARFKPTRFMAACERGANVKLRTNYKVVA